MDKNQLSFLLDIAPAFSLQEMFQGKPQQAADNNQQMLSDFNKTQIPDKRFYGPDLRYIPAISGSRAVQETWDGLQDRNGADTRRYFHPETKIRVTNMKPGTMGYVEHEFPDIVNLSSYHSKNDPMSARTNTLLHEATHVEDNYRKDKKSNLFGDVPGFNYEQLIRKLPEDVKTQHFTAGNAEDTYNEMRANLRASLGNARKGTTEEEHFKSMLDAQNGWTNPIDYYPTEAQGLGDRVQLRSREAIMKGLMNDLFPRERYLEPREPTWKESIQDKIQSLKDMFK